ncbi:hypothetical protein P170DRAFT_174934 [Aspergillus steynii IBT 23096]|uniref:Uncharacterized protein n=1 Tax=Aspergillus steynii IBT 23096 TaxID=1392250 RepID=A0A2I2G8A4_9EURO|nr:uncharacterized protein P170DRAFT_174934 [Aspergillus steynii IBT 23096]PLB49095.1 hypothetical protein P170DRAFT_174934 [Aspergillus steynii IBT 23096]
MLFERQNDQWLCCTRNPAMLPCAYISKMKEWIEVRVGWRSSRPPFSLTAHTRLAQNLPINDVFSANQTHQPRIRPRCSYCSDAGIISSVLVGKLARNLKPSPLDPHITNGNPSPEFLQGVVKPVHLEQTHLRPLNRLSCCSWRAAHALVLRKSELVMHGHRAERYYWLGGYEPYAQAIINLTAHCSVYFATMKWLKEHPADI